jgi:hypothetical protein
LPATPLPPLPLQHLWFRIADKRSWHSLALVPVDDDVSTLTLATALAKMACHEANSRVLVVNASIKDCEPGDSRSSPEMLRDDPAGPHGIGFDLIDFSMLATDEAHRAVASSPGLLAYLETQGRTYTTSVFATDALLVRTPAIPLVRSVDAVIVCVRVGETPLPDITKLAKVIGRERIIGSVAFKPASNGAK